MQNIKFKAYRKYLKFDRKKVQISVSFVNTIFKIRIRKRNPQPATFFEDYFLYVGGVGGGMEKAGSLLGGPAFLYYIQILNFSSVTN